MADSGTDTHQQTAAGVINEELQSTPLENKQEGQTATHLNSEQECSEVDSASSSASTEKENNNYQDKDTRSCNVQGSSSAEDVSVPSTEGSCKMSEECSGLNVQENSTSPEEQDNDDKNGEILHKESAVTTNKHSDKDGSGDKETTERACASPMGDQTDGPPSVENEESSEMKDTGEVVSKGEEEEEEEEQVNDAPSEKQKDLSSTTTTLRKQIIEEIGSITQEETKPTVQEVPKNLEGYRRYWIPVVIIILFAILVQQLLQHESPPQKKDVRQIDVFLREMTKVKTQFPNQRVELWNRSKIHLQRHFQIAHPTEPVSLILTAGLKAERTLWCLAKGLASAFSTALNASVLHIDGTSKASQDSDQVKLDIDSQLQGAFEGNKPVAVIHRFEELPPGSTLIFYRYCDHENAAYKKTFLIFTILLGEEEIPAKVRLSAVEEMVDDHLQKKFLSHGHPTAFDKMDIDKYGGLWSRISHLILPVAAEERVEQKGC